MPAFAVDLDDLLGSVDRMSRCGEALDALLDELSARVAVLHDSWAGASADAQAAAQAEWEAGFREMRAALAVMRDAADSAHGRYSEAIGTNLQMWEQVR